MNLQLVGGPRSRPARAMPGVGPEGSPHRVRIIDGALSCIARQGISKTTLDDVAREAGVSRATVYRVFPGGKDEVLGAVVDTEVARLFSALGVRMGEADDLSEVLVNGIVEASVRISEHPALNYLVEYEPDIVLRHLAFEDANRLLRAATSFTAPFLARWMDPEEAARVAEWAARIVLTYSIDPSDDTRLCDPVRTRHLVETFVLPGIRSLWATDGDQPIDIAPFAADRDSGDGGTTARRHPTQPTTTTRSKGEVR